MDRRKSLKTLFGGAVGTALVTTVPACDRPADPVAETATEAETKGYGLRTAYEAEREERIRSSRFFSDHELAVLTVLGNIIVPDVEQSGFADFCEFMAKDQPENHQVPLRGGLAWLNAESSRRYAGRAFDELTDAERLTIVDDIAYPDPEADEQEPGVKFFNHARFMAVTCFYTSKQGIDYLGYMGNQPNLWDGPPQEVLDKHGLAYDPRWLPLYVDPSQANVQVVWDERGNVVS
jgi:hypothetical protein